MKTEDRCLELLGTGLPGLAALQLVTHEAQTPLLGHGSEQQQPSCWLPSKLPGRSDAEPGQSGLELGDSPVAGSGRSWDSHPCVTEFPSQRSPPYHLLP